MSALSSLCRSSRNGFRISPKNRTNITADRHTDSLSSRSVIAPITHFYRKKVLSNSTHTLFIPIRSYIALKEDWKRQSGDGALRGAPISSVLKKPSPKEVINSLLWKLKKGHLSDALTAYEEVFRPHICHLLERGFKGTNVEVLRPFSNTDQWKLPVEILRLLLRASKDTARYHLSEEFYTLLAQADAVTPQDVNTILSVYTERGDYIKAEHIFQQIEERDPHNPNYIKPTIYLYNGMLKLYKEANQKDRALELWKKMNADPSIELIAASYGIALSCGIFQRDEYSPLLDRMLESSIKSESQSKTHKKSKVDEGEMDDDANSKVKNILSPISYASFMAAVPSDLIRELEPRLTEARKRLSGALQIHHYTAALSAYARAGMRLQTEEIEEELFRAKLHSPAAITTLLALYTRLNLVEHQRRFIMKVRRHNSDLHSITTTMNALAQQGLAGAAINFFREYQKDNIFVDIVAYNAAMRAAAMSANPQLVLELMQEAKDRGLSLNVVSFVMLQLAYSKTDNIEGFRSSMVKLKEELGIDPDAESWTAYLHLLTRLRAPAIEIEKGLHSMISCGYVPQKKAILAIMVLLEKAGEIATLKRIEALAKSGALGAAGAELLARKKDEAPIAPLLKQAYEHSKFKSQIKNQETSENQS